MKKLKLEEEEERIGGVFYQQIYIYTVYGTCVCVYILYVECTVFKGKA